MQRIPFAVGFGGSASASCSCASGGGLGAAAATMPCKVIRLCHGHRHRTGLDPGSFGSSMCKIAYSRLPGGHGEGCEDDDEGCASTPPEMQTMEPPEMETMEPPPAEEEFTQPPPPDMQEEPTQ
jgi:hypothetical protein